MEASDQPKQRSHQLQMGRQRTDDSMRSEGSQSKSARSLARQTRRSQRDFSDTTDDEMDDLPSKGELRRNRRLDRSGSSESLKRNSLIIPEALSSQLTCDISRNSFFKEMENCSLLQTQILSTEPLVRCSQTSDRLSSTSDDANKQSKVAFSVRSSRCRHRFSRVRPLHVCAEHSFVCFRYNGDLVAATPNSVLVYDKPPAACELSYKEPLYSIPISGVGLAADLSHSRILVLRQGSYMASDERAADELLIAEVATGETQLMAKVALPQLSVVRNSNSTKHLMLQEKASRRDGAECRGMQINQTEHKVYLLYDYHLLVMDLNMQLEPLVIRLRCQSAGLGPAVALIEFDHAVYILTADSLLLASSKTNLFSPSPNACCLPVLQRLDSRLAAREIRSYVVDRRQATAFFSVPHGCKLISLAFPVPSSDGQLESAASTGFPVLQERLYAVASSSDGSASVPCAMAWDATTEQLLVLEWGSENNGVLITVDFFPDDGIRGDKDRQQPEAGLQQQTSVKLPVVKTFGPQVLDPLVQRLGLRSSESRVN